MIKKHLSAVLDMELIVFLVVIVALCILLTVLFSAKVTDFSGKHKKVFYVYIFSFVLIYALLVLFGHNKLFSEVSHEFLFYQIVSFLFGILHCWLYQNTFKQFDSKSIGIELLFGTLVILYSSVLFIIIYTALNGIYFTYLMCIHFVLFLCPTGINISFNLMMLIPPPEYATWSPKSSFKNIEGKEMKDILLITLLIKKENDDQDYISIRAQAPVRVDFGRLFILTLEDYNDKNAISKIDMIQPDGQYYSWFFHLQTKWHKKGIQIDPESHIGINSIVENSVIICERKENKNGGAGKKSVQDDKLYGMQSGKSIAKESRIGEIEKEAPKSKIE